MRIGIYGGTFNPPHAGHLEAMRASAEALETDKLFVIPTRDPPHKSLPPDSPTPADRLAMTEIAVDTLLAGDSISVLPLEIDRESASYTSDTVAVLAEQYPRDELWLLMGEDMLRTFPSWHEPEKIAQKVHIAAFAKGSDGEEALLEDAERYASLYGSAVTVLHFPKPVDTCSTAVRTALKEGKRPAELPESVYGYILRHKLYRTNADLRHLSVDDLRACSLSMVYAKRHAHIRGVEEEAQKMAKRWGEDVAMLRRAAVLHDCTKYLSLAEQLQICRKYDIVTDATEESSEKLLHSKTGAAVAEHIYGECAAVCDAIRWHTTGRGNMTAAEKILYLADYVEPNRDFPEVDTLRKLCYEDLDAAMVLGLTMSVEDLTRRGVPIHSRTQEALIWERTICKA